MNAEGWKQDYCIGFLTAMIVRGASVDCSAEFVDDDGRVVFEWNDWGGHDNYRHVFHKDDLPKKGVNPVDAGREDAEQFCKRRFFTGDPDSGLPVFSCDEYSISIEVRNKTHYIDSETACRLGTWLMQRAMEVE